jgi:hypothetical protein
MKRITLGQTWKRKGRKEVLVYIETISKDKTQDQTNVVFSICAMDGKAVYGSRSQTLSIDNFETMYEFYED